MLTEAYTSKVGKDIVTPHEEEVPQEVPGRPRSTITLKHGGDEEHDGHRQRNVYNTHKCGCYVKDRRRSVTEYLYNEDSEDDKHK